MSQRHTEGGFWDPNKKDDAAFPTPSTPVPLDLQAIEAKLPRQVELGTGSDPDDVESLIAENRSLREEVTRLKALPIAVTAFAIPTSTGGHKGVTP